MLISTKTIHVKQSHIPLLYNHFSSIKHLIRGRECKYCNNYPLVSRHPQWTSIIESFLPKSWTSIADSQRVPSNAIGKTLYMPSSIILA